jgi:V/A-type H+-transporting ATPase subunit A
MGVASEWWSNLDRDWEEMRAKALSLLEEASQIEETARIIGEKALPDEQRLVLLIAEIFREGFLVQGAFHEVDTYCDADKQTKLLKIMIEFYNLSRPLIDKGIPIEKVRDLSIVKSLMRLKEEKGVEPIAEARIKMRKELDGLAKEYEVK